MPRKKVPTDADLRVLAEARRRCLELNPSKEPSARNIKNMLAFQEFCAEEGIDPNNLFTDSPFTKKKRQTKAASPPVEVAPPAIEKKPTRIKAPRRRVMVNG
jgi:hypothetical protein